MKHQGNYIVTAPVVKLDFSKTQIEKDILKVMKSNHRQEMRSFYGEAVYKTYRHKLFSINEFERGRYVQILSSKYMRDNDSRTARVKKRGGLILNLQTTK